MVFTVTMNMNPRAQQIRKHGNSGSSIVNGFPANKRPRVGSSPGNKAHCLNINISKGNRLGSGYDSGVNTTSSQNIADDLFGDDDIFTGDALAELEMVASQVENAVKHGNELTKTKEIKTTVKESNPQIAGKFAFKQPNNNLSKNATTSKLSSDGPSDVYMELERLKQQCAQYELKVKDFEQRNKQSSGEASLLRDKLHSTERVLHEERQLKSAEATRLKKEKTNKELELTKKIEIFKDQVQFKEAELKEAQNLIRNLETKNKMLSEESKLVSSTREGMFSNQRQSQADDISHKKIKFVKPESPRVPSSKHKILKVESPRVVPVKSSSSSQEPKPLTMREKRRVCRLQNVASIPTHLPSPAQTQLIHSLQTLLVECKHSSMVHDQNQVEKQKYIDTIHNIEHLTSSSLEKGDEYVFQILPNLVDSTKDCLSKWTASQENAQEKHHLLTPLSTTNCLIRTHPNVANSIMDKTVGLLSVVNNYLSESQMNKPMELTTKLLDFVCLLPESATKPMPGHLTDRLTKTAEVLSIYTVQATLRDHVLNLAFNFVGSQTLVEKIVSPSSNQGASLLSTLCHTSTDEAAKENPSINFLSQVVALLSELTCEHEDLLTKQECFAEIYHTLNVILYYQLTHWETKADISPPRDRLISQSVCLLHSCSNIYVDGIPGVARDHKHLLVLWKLQRFLEKRDGETFWLSELRKIVNSEICSIEQLT
uniref:Uncharacterized protein LOC100175364 n=1 Tax=Phallusia mammillata TaxID=59560 RepID=A0A6F9DGZ8_9ASCI|nr:uncharacterized protein LOC100175364 [Phallusia mammillata]